MLGPTALAALARAPHLRLLYADECHVAEAAHPRRGLALLFTSPSLRCVSLLRCAWLTHALLRECHVARPSDLPPISAAHSLRADFGAASSTCHYREDFYVAPEPCHVSESWEDFHVALADPEAALPAGLQLRTRAAPARRVHVSRDVDWSRPPRVTAAASIYHVSQGDEPYYGDAGKRAPTQTDAHGLRC